MLFAPKEKGQGLVEYAIIIALVAIVVIAVMQLLGPAIIEQLGLAQSARFLTWRWRDAPPIPADEITRSAANVHVIPANAVVARQVAALRAGQRVRAKGVLVEATRPDGWRWRCSLTRDDGSQGACELIYLAEITVLD